MVLELSQTNLQATLPCNYFYQKNNDTVVIMIHGYFDKAIGFVKRTFDNNLSHLPFSILAPNAPFPVPEVQPHIIKEGFSWYFYNYVKNKMIISPEAGIDLIVQIVNENKLENSNKVILGFSQGGFLAPLVAKNLENVQKIICVGSAYREDFWNSDYMRKHNLKSNLKNIPIIGIHGVDDEIIKIQRAQDTFQVLEKNGFKTQFHSLSGLAHTLNSEAKTIIYDEIMKAVKK